jgi:Flp pilus assembly protein TadD
MSAKSKRKPSRRKIDRKRSEIARRQPQPSRSRLARFLDAPAPAILITLIAYLRCVPNEFVYDDNEMITLNRFIGDFALVWKSFTHDSWWFRNPLILPQSAYYRPLQDVWLALNFHLFGFAPAGWHLAMIAVHLVAVGLVFAVARELSDSRWTPLLAATLFGVLPIHAQAIVWPTAIPLPMSAVFELAGLLYFIRVHKAPTSRSPMIIAPIFYALALMSHESAVIFPAILVSYIILIAPFPERAKWRQVISRVAIATFPFFLELAIYLAIRFWVLGFISRPYVTNHMTIAETLLRMPSVVGTYALLLIAPWRAGPVHPIEVVESVTSREFFLPVIALLGLGASAVIGLWNDARRHLYLFCATWIFLSILPMLNLRTFSPIAMVEDRYLYFASVAWCIAISEAIVSFATSAAWSRFPAAIGATALAAVCAGILFHVESFWHDEIALFSTCVEASPRSHLCHDRLGLAFKSRGQLDAAEQQFFIAQDIEPDDGANLYNLGLVHAQMGRNDEATREMKRALTILPDAPPGAFVELAKVADLAGNVTDRDAALLDAAKLPGGAEAVDLGRAELMAMHRDFAGAENALRSSLAHSPNDADEWTLLGTVLAQQGRRSEALIAYQKSLSLRPDPNLRRAVMRMEKRPNP